MIGKDSKEYNYKINLQKAIASLYVNRPENLNI
jgi:hypothetical protein